MKCYTLNFPRPVGLEPTVYLIRPVIVPEICDGYTDPYSTPEITEYSTIKDALIAIIDYNYNDNYLKEIMVK